MCIVAPARVIELDGDDVIVDQVGRRRRASRLLVPRLAAGDWVVIGSGAVLRRLAPGEAAAFFETVDAALVGRPLRAPTGGPS